MRLARAACHADDTPLVDAYTGDGPIYGQWAPYAGMMRDSLTTERGILALAPDVTMFPRRAFTVLGTPWIAGGYNSDYYKGQEIRRSYVIHLPDELATFKTIPEFLAGSAGTQAYAAKLWIKTGKEIDTASFAIDEMNIYAAAGEPLAPNVLANFSGKWSLIHSTYLSAAGFLTATANDLDEPVAETASFATRTYVPATDTYTTETTTGAALRLRWQEHFQYFSKSSETYLRGDLQLMILKATGTPATKDVITLSDGAWRVMSVVDEATHWSIHLRRA